MITDEGRARLRAAAPTYLAGIERHFGAHLDPDEAGTVATALFRVVEAAEQQASLRRAPRPRRSTAQGDGGEVCVTGSGG